MFGRGKQRRAPAIGAAAEPPDGWLTRRLADAAPDLDAVGLVLAEAAASQLGQAAAVWLVDPSGRRLASAVTAGNTEESGLGEPGLGDRLLDALNGPGAVTVDDHILAVRIDVRGRPAGVVAAARRAGPASASSPSFAAFGAGDAAILGDLARQAGLAVDNARLYAAARTETAERRRVESTLRAQAVQQAALAELSQRALAGADPGDLMRDTVIVVAETLGVAFAGVVELGGTVRATAGSTERHLTAAAERDEPVLEDGAAAVPVPGRIRPFGVLEVAAPGRVFVPEDVGFLQAVANVLALAIERADNEAEIRHQALHDALTGLPNRALLGDRLEHAIHAFRRDHRPLALLLMDLDGFKEINDTLGHHVGDAVLSAVGRRLADVVRQTDTVARLGGDEFAMVLLGVDADEAKAVATKVLHAVEQPLDLDGVSLRPRASIGISLAPRHGTDGATLLRCADVAMYRAKQFADGWSLYDASYDHHDVRRLALATELREAIDRDQLVCHYQPIIDLADHGVAGVEALVRWEHPVLGLVRPDHFIPLAEETGLIRPLTWWVLGEAIRQIRAWERSGAGLTVSVNISARMLHDPELVPNVTETVASSGIQPSHLVLEITESGVMANPATARETIEALTALGVGVAIDDFGTGYSSLAYLQRLPVQEIKVDRSFVTGMAANRTDASIVRSVIELGHSLGMSVVAEGVELADVAQLLAELGCDAAQGYHLGEPVPPEQLRRLASAS